MSVKHYPEAFKIELVELDAEHNNHLNVYDSTGAKVKAVLNLDGAYNDAKTKAARVEGRRLPK